MKLTGNTILITGGTSGIGLAFAKEFLRLGNKVIICGRRENRLKEISHEHPAMITRRCDVAESDDRESLATWVLQQYPEVNVLINNAGLQLLTNLTGPVDLTRVNSEIAINVVAPIHLTSLFTQTFVQKENAAIINISSGLAFVPLAFMPVYCATKAAIHSITLSLRHQLKDTSVKVFEIAPPAVDTELGADRRADKTQSHGGMPVDEFLAEAIEAIRSDVFMAPIGGSKWLYDKRESMFESMNQPA